MAVYTFGPNYNTPTWSIKRKENKLEVLWLLLLLLLYLFYTWFCGTCKPLAPTQLTGWPGQQWLRAQGAETDKWPFVIYLTLLKSIPLLCSLISHAALNACHPTIQSSRPSDRPTLQSPAKVQIAYGKWSWRVAAAYVSLPLLFQQLFCIRTVPFSLFFAPSFFNYFGYFILLKLQAANCNYSALHGQRALHFSR